MTHAAAFATGGLLTIMVLLNGTLAAYGSALFASWVPHATGTVAALIALWAWPKRTVQTAAPAPLWAYLGGISGAITVMLTSVAINTPLALSGTLALGLAGQVGFGLAADRWGLFGLPKRAPTLRDAAALALILAGSGLIIFGERA